MAHTASTAWLIAALTTLCAVHQVFAASVGGPWLSYENGGADWGGVCETGKRQSPVNLLTEEMVPMKFYRDMVHIHSLGVYTDLHSHITENLPHFEVSWETIIKEANVTVPATEEGDVFFILSDPYPREKIIRVALEPKQFHYHVSSESAVNGDFHDGVIHIVTMVKDGESRVCDRIKIAGGLGCPVVLSIFLTNDVEHDTVHDQFLGENAEAEKELEEILGEQPLISTTGKEHGAEIEGTFDLTELLPKDGKYATWEGSLTTSPCTEGVLWVSFLTPVGIDMTTVKKLKTMVAHAAGEDCEAISNGKCSPPRPPLDNRDIQPLNGRAVRTGRAFY